MNIIVLGAAGFIGTNLSIALANNKENKVTLVDRNKEYFNKKLYNLENIRIIENNLNVESDFETLLNNQDIVYHLVSSNIPSTSNQQISQELFSNVIFSSNLFDACVKVGVKKVVFISSGGTVYGKESTMPLKEETQTNPITSYGIQKITIEKLLYLYNYMYGLDYRVIRLANPFGPYQRPNGVLGAVTTFTYKALKDEEIEVYGDGTVVRDFIYIDDAIRGILKIAEKETDFHTYNLGSGKGISINQLLDILSKTLDKKLKVSYKNARKVDVPVNYLDISRYEKNIGKIGLTSLEEGILLTARFMKENKIV